MRTHYGSSLCVHSGCHPIGSCKLIKWAISQAGRYDVRVCMAVRRRNQLCNVAKKRSRLAVMVHAQMCNICCDIYSIFFESRCVWEREGLAERIIDEQDYWVSRGNKAESAVLQHCYSFWGFLFKVLWRTICMSYILPLLLQWYL